VHGVLTMQSRKSVRSVFEDSLRERDRQFFSDQAQELRDRRRSICRQASTVPGPCLVVGGDRDSYAGLDTILRHLKSDGETSFHVDLCFRTPGRRQSAS
jgi:hypothetical protein